MRCDTLGTLSLRSRRTSLTRGLSLFTTLSLSAFLNCGLSLFTTLSRPLSLMISLLSPLSLSMALRISHLWSLSFLLSLSQPLSLVASVFLTSSHHCPPAALSKHLPIPPSFDASLSNTVFRFLLSTIFVCTSFCSLYVFALHFHTLPSIYTPFPSCTHFPSRTHTHSPSLSISFYNS